MLSQALAGLRDVDEVQGSFLLGEQGTLLARDLPTVFGAEIFAEVGPRLVRLREMFDAEKGSSMLTLRFSDHKLHVRSVGSMLLCVLSGASVNEPALRMAVSLVARRIEGTAVETVEELPTPSKRTPSPPAEVTEPPSSTAQPRNVLYRGRRTT